MHSTAHGVLAPNAKLRREIVPSPLEQATEPSCDRAHAQGTPARMSWARLLKRVFDIDIDHCPNCGGGLKIIAAIEDPPVIVKILSHLGLHPRPRARRSDSIYSKRPEQPKTACQRKPTAPLALSSSVRRDLEHFARHRPLRRPSQPKQHWDFHQPERQLTTRRAVRYSSDQKKRWFKFPIRPPLLLIRKPTIPTKVQTMIWKSIRPFRLSISPTPTTQATSRAPKSPRK